MFLAIHMPIFCFCFFTIFPKNSKYSCCFRSFSDITERPNCRLSPPYSSNPLPKLFLACIWGRISTTLLKLDPSLCLLSNSSLNTYFCFWLKPSFCFFSGPDIAGKVAFNEGKSSPLKTTAFSHHWITPSTARSSSRTHWPHRRRHIHTTTATDAYFINPITHITPSQITTTVIIYISTPLLLPLTSNPSFLFSKKKIKHSKNKFSMHLHLFHNFQCLLLKKKPIDK